MTCSQCIGIERQFSEGVARRDLRRYRKRGPSKSTLLLLEQLEAVGVRDATFLDVGGGVGALQHALMGAGASGGTHVDAASSYLVASREEAERRGYADRIVYVEGDVVELADDLERADLVTLDRVLCCYHDMPALVDASAARAGRAVGLVYPRERRLTRFGVRLVNLLQALRRHPFRVYLHDVAATEARLAGHGFSRSAEAHTVLWRVTTFTRSEREAA